VLQQIGIGWRWTSWLSAILSGINIFGIVFFLPETRFHRILDNEADQTVSAAHRPKEDRESKEVAIEEVSANPVLVGQKKTMWQDMKIFSEVASHSYMNHLIRPFPLLFYPSVAWGTFVCEYHAPNPAMVCQVNAYCTPVLVSLAWLMAAGSLSSFIFQVPPYNFGPGVNGLVQLAGLSEYCWMFLRS
jgi:hypothetical protein